MHRCFAFPACFMNPWSARAMDCMTQECCPQRHLPGPVLSVGNITMGGTGKTPLVLYIAQVLTQRGFQPAILTRGYKRAQSSTTRILAPKEGVPSAARVLGDEPAVMRRHILFRMDGHLQKSFSGRQHNFPKAAASGFYPGRRFSASQALSGPGHSDSRPKPGAAIQSRIPAWDAARTAIRITSMPCYCAERHAGRRRRGSGRRRDCAPSPEVIDFLLQPNHTVPGSLAEWDAMDFSVEAPRPHSAYLVAALGNPRTLRTGCAAPRD